MTLFDQKRFASVHLQTTFDLKPEPHHIMETMRGTGEPAVPVRYAVYDIKKLSSSDALNVDVKYIQQPFTNGVLPPTVTARRFQTGHGHVTGGIVCFIYNNHPTEDIIVAYQDIVPWFMRVYLHTLKIETFSSLPDRIDLSGMPLKPIGQHYVPGRDRQRPYQLELVLKLPKNSVTRISFDFERQLLKWTEYPPDANHGFYVGSAVISTLLPDARNFTSPDQNSSMISSIFEATGVGANKFFIRLHTECLLVTLPTPDFSMPYNVICLACTVLAIAFGSMHNLTTRRFVIYDRSKRGGLLTKARSAIGAVLSLLRLGKRKANESSPAEGEETTKERESSSSGDSKSTT